VPAAREARPIALPKSHIWLRAQVASFVRGFHVCTLRRQAPEVLVSEVDHRPAQVARQRVLTAKVSEAGKGAREGFLYEVLGNRRIGRQQVRQPPKRRACSS
jgi:hypothetical protein